VDVMLTLDPPREGRSSFLIEDSTLPQAVVPETMPVSFTAGNRRPGDPASGADGEDAFDRLLTRQRTAPLPRLYGQKAGKIPSEPLVKAGVSEVIDGGEKVRHPPRSGWLDGLGRLKGGWSMGLGVARCAPYGLIQNCPLAPSAASCSRMYMRTCSSSNPTVDSA
jgi:hypothetical protein